MARKDFYHDTVRVALEKDGWRITADPLTVSTRDRTFFVDLAAERDIIEAEREGEQVAIEIKSLLDATQLYDFYQGVGQFLIYRLAMRKVGLAQPLFLAIPTFAYKKIIKVEIFRDALTEFSINLLVFDEVQKTILQWLRN